MIPVPALRALTDADVRALDVLPAGAVNLRRDVHLLVRHIEAKGLRRTRRGNRIPRVAARRLAALLSWAGEKAAVEDDGEGVWSERVCDVARALGLLSYDTEGVYVGYTSTEPSFPDNDVEVEPKAWKAWCGKGALEKERALLDALVEVSPNEFFHWSTLVPGECFDTRGCATGPAGQMDLPRIRRALLDLLAELEPGIWFELREVVDLLQARHPHLILDPAHRGPSAESHEALRRWRLAAYDRRERSAKPPDVVPEDLYVNFSESPPGRVGWGGSDDRRFTSESPDVFHRVQGRYVEFFLREIPYLLGFVELGYRPESDRHGSDVSPPFERLRALRTTPRLRAVVRGDTAFDAVNVTVLPTFEVLVEAQSYPDSILDSLAPLAALEAEGRWVQRLRLERARVTAAAANDPAAPRPATLLTRLTGRALPQNVAFELARWTERGEQATLWEGLGVLEVRGGRAERAEARKALGDLVLDKNGGAEDAFILVKDPEAAFRRLEALGLCPLGVKHADAGFARCDGPLGRRAGAPTGTGRGARSADPPASRPTAASLEPVDLVGYRSDTPALLAALHEGLAQQAGLCCLAADDLLVVSSSLLPALRRTLRGLAGRFAVTSTDSHRTGGLPSG